MCRNACNVYCSGKLFKFYPFVHCLSASIITAFICKGSPTVVIDGYTHNSTLTSGGSVPFGTQLLLVCQVVGLPYGTPLSYTWTCPNEPCELEGYYGRRVYNEHILAVNTTSTSDGGPYTCQVTATEGQVANGSITVTFKVAGMCYTTAAYVYIKHMMYSILKSNTLNYAGCYIVHSYGRLIPRELPITDLQQISGPDGIGRINCTVSSGTASFRIPGGSLTAEVNQTNEAALATLVVTPTFNSNFSNRDVVCNGTYFYLFPSANCKYSKKIVQYVCVQSWRTGV